MSKRKSVEIRNVSCDMFDGPSDLQTPDTAFVLPGSSSPFGPFMSVEDLVASFISPSEQVKVALQTLVSSNGTVSLGDHHAESLDLRRHVQDTRILAVVSHFDEWNMTEEGWYVLLSLSLLTVHVPVVLPLNELPCGIVRSYL